MGNVSGYILSVVASAIVCGCISMLPGKAGGSRKIISTLCGIYMVFVLIAPLSKVEFAEYFKYFSDIESAAQEVVADGESIAQKELAGIITEQLQAYILDKAAELGTSISVEITLSGETPPVPDKITIKGAVSPYVKKVLSKYITQQLGVPEEAQRWI